MFNFTDNIINENYLDVNIKIEKLCGIVDCFSSDEEKNSFFQSLDFSVDIINESRVSYGDWQTPFDLSKKVCLEHKKRYGSPDIIIEPTCGLGSFVISAMDAFPNLTEIHAIEINGMYVSELKKSIILRAIVRKERQHPKIYLHVADVFKFNFNKIADRLKGNNSKIAIIGNPPWVTNSKQSQLESQNIPIKSNLYRLKGIDAIMGKSNFDISEFITLLLIRTFQHCSGGISLLLKNSVIRNLIYKQHEYPLAINNIAQLKFDATKEFNVAVEASCFTAILNQGISETCQNGNIYTQAVESEFGWAHGSFVSDIQSYALCQQYDSKCDYIWRSGIKHDCASILELTHKNGQYYNKLGELVDIEDDLIFPYLKSSYVNNYTDYSYKDLTTFILVPQRYVGESSLALQSKLPKTYSYLISHVEYFTKRKSSIYKNKDIFIVFGIGDYTFLHYKIVVSSLYKEVRFKLISPYKGKPIIVDDTCYQLAFESKAEATAVLKALNSDKIQLLLETLIFKDAKRVVTKGILMRLDLYKYMEENDFLIPKINNRQNLQPSLFDSLQ